MAPKDIGSVLENINAWVWGPWTFFLFIGTGIFLTVRLKLLPWKNLGFSLRQVCSDIIHPRKGDGKNISPFQSLMTAMAAMMGTGNIAGVAAAMVLGGPGALIWMILSAFIAMALSLTENVLTMDCRKKNGRGLFFGGPMYVMEEHIRPRILGKLLAVLFSLFMLGASLGMGNMTQANSISEALRDTFQIPPALTGGILFFLCLLILTGGISCIGKVCGFLVPIMSVAYFGAAILVILINIENLPSGLMEMISMAFSPSAVAGGLGGSILAGMGQAMRWGIARGVFSNEAGLGSAPVASAAADTDDVIRQSDIALTATFFDTIVVCSATGLAIASSGLLGARDLQGQFLSGVALTNKVFESALGPAGRFIISGGITMFAFATIIGWEYYGEMALNYLSDRCRHLRTPLKITFIYRIVYCAFAAVGAMASLQAVWDFSDIMNAAMAIPNLICVLLLNRRACELLFKYEDIIKHN